MTTRHSHAAQITICLALLAWAPDLAQAHAFVNDLTAGGQQGQPAFPLDVDLIDRAKIIRGPGSSLYGTNAFFGVINVITRRGRDFDDAELSGSYGSFDTWTGRASYGQHLTDGLEFVVSGTLSDSAGQDRLSYPEFVAENLDGSWARNLFASFSYRDFKLPRPAEKFAQV